MKGKKGRHREKDVRVSTSYDSAVGTFGICEIEEANHLGNSGRSGSSREKVTANCGVVGSAYTLDPDVCAAVLVFESVAEGDAESALDEFVSYILLVKYRIRESPMNCNI